MPNHVENRITFECDAATWLIIKEKVLLASDDAKASPRLDFEKIIPMPEGIFRGDLGENERRAHPVNWYDWSIQNWGTKWNAYETRVNDAAMSIQFRTAWGAPLPVIKALAAMLPGNICFDYCYADEDTGRNAGKLRSVFGVLMGGPLVNGSDEAYDLAFELHGPSKCYYKDADGHWQQYDCSDCPWEKSGQC